MFGFITLLEIYEIIGAKLWTSTGEPVSTNLITCVKLRLRWKQLTVSRMVECLVSLSQKVNTISISN